MCSAWWCGVVVSYWAGVDSIGFARIVSYWRKGKAVFFVVLVVYCIGPELTAEYLYSPSMLALRVIICSPSVVMASTAYSF